MNRHEWPNPEDPSRPPLWATRDSTNASERSLRTEVLRLAKVESEYEIFVAELIGTLRLDREAIDRAGLMPGNHVLKEVRRLAESRDAVWKLSAVRAERERIREALTTFAQEVCWNEVAFRPFPDRICPEEPRS